MVRREGRKVGLFRFFFSARFFSSSRSAFRFLLPAGLASVGPWLPHTDSPRHFTVRSDYIVSHHPIQLPSSFGTMISTAGYHRSDNAEVYRKNASFVYSSANTAAVLRLLDAQRGDKILDLGCGTLRFRLSLKYGDAR